MNEGTRTEEQGRKPGIAGQHCEPPFLFPHAFFLLFVRSHMSTHFNWWIDGTIVGVYLLATMIAGIMVRKYVGKVEHFLVAGREMNLYLGIASLAATEFGIITCMYTAQNGYQMGFAGAVP